MFFMKKERNKKIHEGEVDMVSIEDVLIFEDINKLLGKETTDAEKTRTDEILNEAFERCDIDIKKTSQIILEILEEAEMKLSQMK